MPEPHESTAVSNDDYRQLRADCENCFGLCCVALPFSASVDFAVDKHAGQRCHNLGHNFRCGVHQDLREIGYRGCTVYDCFGAGQQVAQVTYSGKDWVKAPETAKQMFEVFPIMRQLHELLWYLTEALELEQTQSIHEALRSVRDETERLTALSSEALLKLDIAAHRANVNVLLLQTSELVRSTVQRQLKTSRGRHKSYGRGADLIGANLRGADLRGAHLRGAYLIAADLIEADFRSADLIGADFRDANLSGADFTGSLFLTQFQINAAKGDSQTKLPKSLSRPPHWSA
ncbi:pentapeptide repeat-containing protein [Paenibacillus sp. MAH-36]|uniref:Pentapeptide repeat-containing protein n=1 Tax=Paenibacillus violae TaxID=3077234 RepID=A0ABU3R8B4_9BACL|nr:pentapeptide repeat-containing protein [Paenibacillus sp. PFR10]MDU0200509.1 pentapeptide repeat-containing protein [Paenibacillus sp. PFR10]